MMYNWLTAVADVGLICYLQVFWSQQRAISLRWAYAVLELLAIKFYYAELPIFSTADIEIVIECLHTSWLLYCPFFVCIFLQFP